MFDCYGYTVSCLTVQSTQYFVSQVYLQNDNSSQHWFLLLLLSVCVRVFFLCSLRILARTEAKKELLDIHLPCLLLFLGTLHQKYLTCYNCILWIFFHQLFILVFSKYTLNSNGAIYNIQHAYLYLYLSDWRYQYNYISICVLYVLYILA